MANKNFSALITIGGAVAGSLKTAIGSTTSQLGQIGSEIRRVKRDQDQLGSAIQTFGRMGKNVDNLRTKYSTVTTELERLTKAQEKLNRVESARLKNQQNLDKAKGQIGAAVATTFAVFAPLKTAIDKSSEFNYQLQLIGNTANMTKSQIGSMKTEILAISKELGNMPTEVMEAQGFLIAAGMTQDVAAKMLRPVGKAAVATGAAIDDVSRAAFTLNDTLNVTPEKMPKVLDALVQSGKEGNFEFKAMAENLPVLGASFKALKMEGVEAAATMGAALQIARKGAGDESEAANNMKNFMAKIMSPDTLKKAKKFGVDLYGEITKAQKNGGNAFETAIEQVYRMTKGGDQKLIGELFGDMQVQNFIRPMLQNLEEYKRIKQAALSADGVTDKDFQSIGGTSKSSMQAIGGAISRAWIAIGTAIEPVLVSITGKIVPLIDKFTLFVENNPKVISSIATILVSLTAFKVGALALKLAIFGIKKPILGLVEGFVKVNNPLEKSGSIFTKLGNKINRLKNPLGNVKIGFGAITPILKQIGFALLRTPWGAVAAIAVGAGLAIYKYWDYIKAFFQGFWTGLKQGIEPFTSAVGKLIQSTPLLSQAWNLVSGAISKVFTWFKNLLTPVQATKEGIGQATSVGEKFGKLVGGAINLVLTPLKAVVNLFSWIINNVSKIGSAWTSVKSFFGGSGTSQAPSSSRPLPIPPPIARAPSSKVMTPNQISNSFTIHAAPGQNPKEIAAEAVKLMNRSNGIAMRSSMLDAGYSQ